MLWEFLCLIDSSLHLYFTVLSLLNPYLIVIYKSFGDGSFSA